MFSGIVKARQKVLAVSNNNSILRVDIVTPSKWKLSIGESISVNGICSTLVSKTKARMSFDYMRETLKVTNIGLIKVQDELNLEKGLRLNEVLDGHMVSGHVDGVGTVKSIHTKGDSKVVSIIAPKNILKLLVLKGSIAINGVSLTISKVSQTYFEVSLIPHTLKVTNLHKLKPGDKVNVEIDMIAKYLYKYAKKTK